MNANPIQFFFDFSSPYGYLAAQKIDALVAEWEALEEELARGSPERALFVSGCALSRAVRSPLRSRASSDRLGAAP